MRLIVDSGSTKTDWIAIDDSGNILFETQTLGLNPQVLSEAIVEELESGDLPLEKAMQKFEQGVKLTRSCQSALRDAEQKVEILLKSAGGEESLDDFDVADED